MSNELGSLSNSASLVFTAMTASVIMVGCSTSEDPRETFASDESDVPLETGDTSGTSSDTSETSSDTDGEPPGDSETSAPEGVCGDGVVNEGEVCDDGNSDDFDSCTSKCAPPSCDDGLHSGDESDVDCGGACEVCLIGGACSTGTDCSTSHCTDGVCGHPTSCLDLLNGSPGADDGVTLIDPDGLDGEEPFEVFCDQTTDSGGWTLVATVSDDGVPTWTWDTRWLLSTDTSTFGSLDQLDHDFKSPAYHSVKFEGIMFRHSPSGMWAAYGAVSGGNFDLGQFVSSQPAPLCGAFHADNGYTLTAGNLAQGGSLCDQDLYFHLGDHDGYSPCGDENSNGTYGPGWNMSSNEQCPFDDPSWASFGLNPGGASSQELPALGFGNGLGLNAGVPGSAENHLQMFVR